MYNTRHRVLLAPSFRYRSTMEVDEMPRKLNIPYGFCHCGCGERTRMASRSDPRFGHVKNMPLQFVFGHGARHPRQVLRYGKLDGKSVVYIPLTQGYWAIVDRDKFYLVKDGVWCYAAGYAYQKRAGKMVAMQNVIMSPPAGKI